MRLLKNSLLIFAMTLAFWACSQDDDGPLDLTLSDAVFDGKGFFRASMLDSGDLIHLVGDTLFVHMDSIWSFSNCALKKIGVVEYREDTVLILKPYFDLHVTGEDCAAPLYRPDTVLRFLPDKDELKGISTIRIKNDSDKVLDTIFVRRGEMELDTLSFYIDSLFDSVHSLPLRTKNSPSVLRVLDSIHPQVFMWRTMKSNCALRIDQCDSVVADTLYPSSWRLNDTNLVPVHLACADSDQIFCHSSRWENDSNSLGEVQQRPDTIWYTSTYYVEEIPECGAVNFFNKGSFLVGNDFSVIRELYVPEKSETFCGPSTTKDLYFYDIGRNRYVADTVDVDSLYEIWKSATVVKKK